MLGAFDARFRFQPSHAKKFSKECNAGMMADGYTRTTGKMLLALIRPDCDIGVSDVGKFEGNLVRPNSANVDSKLVGSCLEGPLSIRTPANVGVSLYVLEFQLFELQPQS